MNLQPCLNLICYRDKPRATWQSSEESSVGDLKLRLRPDRSLQQSVSNSSRILLPMVAMVGNRVVAAEIIVVLVANERESFTGATMVNCFYFHNWSFNFCLFFNLSQICSRIFLRLLIVQSRPKKYSDFTTLVPVILFLPLMFLIFK